MWTDKLDLPIASSRYIIRARIRETLKENSAYKASPTYIRHWLLWFYTNLTAKMQLQWEPKCRGLWILLRFEVQRTLKELIHNRNLCASKSIFFSIGSRHARKELKEQSVVGVVLAQPQWAGQSLYLASFPPCSMPFVSLCLNDLTEFLIRNLLACLTFVFPLSPHHSDTNISNVIERISIALKLSTRVRDMFGSNLSWGTGYPERVFMVSLSLQANTSTVPRLGH
jgi:hypothetical protein